MAPPPHRPVSGTYRGQVGEFTVELRVDIDGSRPTQRLSADYFRKVGDTHEYRFSMRVDAPRIRFESPRVTITGTGTFTRDTAFQRIQVTIPRVGMSSSPAGASLRHLDGSGRKGAAYDCAFESDCFRRVDLEEACQEGVARFVSYDTATLPCAGPARTLSTVAAYREAGVKMVTTAEPTVIRDAMAGTNETWSDAELLAAMETSFTRWSDRERWAIWLLHASDHDDPDIGGLMFDRRGAQRQGCAVFYGAKQRMDPDAQRNHLFNCVHELGHGFNLLHSWEKSLAQPPVPSRPQALSWMNYPERFRGGPGAYWSAFPFAFDDAELVHLRHGYQHEVIMGGAPLKGGAARRDGGWESGPRDTGLRLHLDPQPPAAIGVPVTIGARLTVTSPTGRVVPPIVGPQSGTMDVLIRGPDGEESLFVPLLRHCREPEAPIMLDGGRSLRSRPFIHFGQTGFSFPTPGRYSVRARYAGFDGRIALSNAIDVRILPPATPVDRSIDRLVAGDAKVATLMSVMGSDAPELEEADVKLQEIIERYPTHPAAAAARLVRGTNLARAFKQLTDDNTLTSRPAEPRQAAGLIGAVIDVPRIERVARAAQPRTTETRAVARAIMRVGARREFGESVDGFVLSRRQELTAVSPVVGAGTRELRQSAPRATPFSSRPRADARSPSRRPDDSSSGSGRREGPKAS
jgi:hypothetical protein